MKLVPLSHLIQAMGPRKEQNLLSAEIRAEVSMASITSTCTALVQRQVNSTAHLFASAEPPRFFLVMTCHGPNTSIPTLVNGGVACSLSLGKWLASQFATYNAVIDHTLN